MSGIAIVMMVIACVTVFGGVIAAMIHVQRNPYELSGEFGDEERLGAELRKTTPRLPPVFGGSRGFVLFALAACVSHASRSGFHPSRPDQPALPRQSDRIPFVLRQHP